MKELLFTDRKYHHPVNILSKLISSRIKIITVRFLHQHNDLYIRIKVFFYLLS